MNNQEYIKNAKKPQNSFLGRKQLASMNKRHNDLAIWGLSHLQFGEQKSALDIGCGGGRNVAHLLELCPQAFVIGADYSEQSVAKSKKVNRKAIKKSRAEIVLQDANNLIFPNKQFDIITAFETVYFWDNIQKTFLDIYNLLSEQGHFLICNEAQGLEGNEHLVEIIDGMQFYSGEQLDGWLRKAGFKQVTIDKHINGKWLSVVASK